MSHGSNGNGNTLYSVHHGFALKQFIASKQIDVTKAAKVMQVVRQTVYMLYGEEEFRQLYIDRLTKAGLAVPGINAPGGPVSRDVSNLREKVDMLQQMVDMQKKIIAQYEGGSSKGKQVH